MKMVLQQAIGISINERPEMLGVQFEKEKIILIFDENVFPIISAVENMIKDACLQG